MAGRPGRGQARARGNIEELRSGALRVRPQDQPDELARGLLEFLAAHGAAPSRG